jgi:hypothetical protein
VKTVDTYGTFEEAVAGASPGARALAHAVRRLLRDVYPGVTEVPWPNLRVVGYGIGAKKSTEHFGYIATHGAYVNLGLNHGAGVADPEGLLEGAGKTFRHVKVRREEDLARPALRALVEAAIAERERALGRPR